MILSSATDTGRRRFKNEDRHFAVQISPRFLAAAVIDGCGGHAAGDVCAQLTADSLLSGLRARLEIKGTLDGDALTEALTEANNYVVDYKNTSFRFGDMACVASAVLLDTESMILSTAHIGDTRVYIANADGITKLTRDHSPIGRYLDAGLITEAEAMHHPGRNRIDRAIGISRIDAGSGYIFTAQTNIAPGDTIVLCSDGLYDEIISTGILAAINDPAIARTALAPALVALANEAGGHDNITAVTISI